MLKSVFFNLAVSDRVREVLKMGLLRFRFHKQVSQIIYGRVNPDGDRYTLKA
ncbi:MAG: hypothetical protein QW374_02585 [Candidatus Bathyarchaeia archaeon]|nr:hypothetical protein [Candidatus Bathyarchaeota archaeon]